MDIFIAIIIILEVLLTAVVAAGDNVWFESVKDCIVMADAGTDCSWVDYIFSAIGEYVIDASAFTTWFMVSGDGD